MRNLFFILFALVFGNVQSFAQAHQLSFENKIDCDLEIRFEVICGGVSTVYYGNVSALTTGPLDIQTGPVPASCDFSNCAYDFKILGYPGVHSSGLNFDPGACGWDYCCDRFAPPGTPDNCMFIEWNPNQCKFVSSAL